MDRREFLHPDQIAHVAGQALVLLDLSLPPDFFNEPDDSSLLRLSRRYMATNFEVVVPFSTPNALEIGESAFDLLDRLEAQMSVYRESSEICHINRLAFHQAVPVESRLFALLQQAASLSELTGGAFDVSAGALVKAWGFFRGPRRVPTDSERAAALERCGMNHVAFDPTTQTVKFQRPGLEINLGSIGKGYALDRLAEHLSCTRNLPAVLLQGGFSSVYAKGESSADQRGWPIDLRHPHDPERRLARVWLRDRGLGTSAATFRYMEHEGRKLGHILNPRTGWPASGIASATAIAPSAAEADALSTAFFVGGLELAKTVCEARPDVGTVILPEGDAEPVFLGIARSVCSH